MGKAGFQHKNFQSYISEWHFNSLTKMSSKLHEKFILSISLPHVYPLKEEHESSLDQDPKRWNQRVKSIIPISTLITMSHTTIYTYTDTLANPSPTPEERFFNFKEETYFFNNSVYIYMIFTKSYQSSPLSDFLVPKEKVMCKRGYEWEEDVFC